MDAVELLRVAGWTEVGSRKHRKWRCPCGKHQISSASTGSDRRGEKNFLSDIRRTGCPSIVALDPEPDHPWPKEETPKCFFCGEILVEGRYKKDWVYHNGIFACLPHPGVGDWHREQRRRKKKGMPE